MPKKKKELNQEPSPEEIKRQLEEVREKEKEVLNIQKEERQKRIQEFKAKKKGRTPRALLGCLLAAVILVLIIVGWIFSLKHKFSQTADQGSEIGQLFGNLKGNFGEVFSQFDEQMQELEDLTQTGELTPEELEKIKEKIQAKQPQVYSSETKPAPSAADQVENQASVSSWLTYYNDDQGYRLKYPPEWSKEFLESSDEALSDLNFKSEQAEFLVKVYPRGWFDKNLGQEQFSQETISGQEVLISADSANYYFFSEEKIYLINFSVDFEQNLKKTIVDNFFIFNQEQD